MKAPVALTALDKRYSTIRDSLAEQKANYLSWLANGEVNLPVLQRKATELGLALDGITGQIRYVKGPNGSRLGCSGTFSYSLMYVRHGKTEGNTEPRVFQGFVDEPSNHLNEIGLAQAECAADKVQPLELLFLTETALKLSLCS